MSQWIDAMGNMEAEIKRLRAWKESALAVMQEWNKVADALEVDKIGPLGYSRAAIALREVQRLKALEGGK